MFIELTGTALDFFGVFVIAAGTLAATAAFVFQLLRNKQVNDAYRSYRQGVGRAILLGLELLVAGDIIKTVAISPTFQTVGVLAIVVAIRTLLSVSLQVELDGRWPWRSRPSPASATNSSD